MATRLADFYRGDTKTFNLTFTQNGVPLDLTGAVVTFTMKLSRDDADSAAALQQTAVINADPTTGLATLTLGAAATTTLAGTYYYDFQLRRADGSITTLALGTITVHKDVTRAT